MEITEKKYYCPKCFKQVNNQPGFDPLLSAWTCVNCGYEFKINNVEQYTAPEAEAVKEAPVVDTDVIEYNGEIEEVEPVAEAPVVIEEDEHTVEPVQDTEDIQNEEPATPSEVEMTLIEPEEESEVVAPESDEPTDQPEKEPEISEEEPEEEPAAFLAKQESSPDEAAAADDQDQPANQDGVSFSSNAENEEVQEKKVGFFGKLFGDEKPREKSKHVLDFLRDQEEEQTLETEEPASQDESSDLGEEQPSARLYESEPSYTSDDSYVSEQTFNPGLSQDQESAMDSYQSDPFNMQSGQEALESEINGEEEPKKQGFIGSFFEKQEQKQSEKDVLRMQKDRERMEQAIDRRDYRRKKRRKWLISHWMLVCSIVAFLILASIGGYKFFQWRKLTVVGIDPQECIDQNYVDVVEEFANNGFTNVKSVPVEDLSMANLDHEGEVISISINQTLTFTSETKFPYDAPVIIQYHSAAMVSAPMSSRDAKKLTYTEAVAKFKEAGFENIDIIPQADLITGWLHSDGSVARITIGGTELFNTGDSYRVDSKVVVTYHTFKSSEPKKEDDKKEESKKEESKTEDSKADDAKTDSSKKEESTADSSEKDDAKTDTKTDKK